MSFTHSFQREPSPFVLLRAVGALNLVLWADAMRQVIADRTFRDTMPILLDAMDAAEPPPPSEAVIIARIWRLLSPRSRGAIVARDGAMFGAARLVEESSEDRVRAFTELPTALQWLLDSRTDEMESRPKGAAKRVKPGQGDRGDQQTG